MKTYLCTQCITVSQPTPCYLICRHQVAPTTCHVNIFFDARWVEYADITEAVALTHQARLTAEVTS